MFIPPQSLFDPVDLRRAVRAPGDSPQGEFTSRQLPDVPKRSRPVINPCLALCYLPTSHPTVLFDVHQ